MNYRGYYIDGAIFTSKADIDAHIKSANIQAYKTRMQLFAHYVANGKTDLAVAISIDADNIARYLVKHCGLSWDDIESIEATALAA